MADKLQWLNQHLVLLRYQTVRECREQENCKVPLALNYLCAEAGKSSEDFIRDLYERGFIKECCEFLSYALHKRAMLWWGYQCVLSLEEELRAAPAVEVNLRDIGKKKEFPLPDWAKEAPAPEMPDSLQEQLDNTLGSIRAALATAESRIPAEVRQVFDKLVDDALKEYEKKFGVNLKQALNDAIAALGKADQAEKIPIHPELAKSLAELEAKIEQSRLDTLDLVVSAVPKKPPEIVAAQKASALDCVYAFLAAPTPDNAQRAMECGNAAPDTPQGMLASTAFWTYGNLMPQGKMVIKTPPGLAANGLNSVLLMCAAHQGGTRKFKQRYEHYLKLGLDIACGKSDPAAALEQQPSPHRHLAAAAAGGQDQAPPIDRFKDAQYSGGKSGGN